VKLPPIPTSNMPNPEIPKSQLFLDLQMLPRPHRIVDYPRKFPAGHPKAGQTVGQVAIRPLTQEEQFNAAKNADKFAREHMGERPKNGEVTGSYFDVYNNSLAMWMVCYGCRDPKNLDYAIFPTPSILMKVLTQDELAVLFRLQLQVQADIGPIIANLTPAEIEVWISTLQEGADGSFLGFLSSDEVDRLTMYAVSELKRCREENQTLRTVLSSAGLLPAEFSESKETSLMSDEFNGDTTLPVDEFNSE
jgi:hypothetical protein